MKQNKINIKSLQQNGFHTTVYHGRTYVNNEDGSVVLMSRRDAKLSGLTETHTVFCKGGYTYVKLTTPDGVEAIGKRNFNKNEHFNRKFGLNIAVGRALAKLEK